MSVTGPGCAACDFKGFVPWASEPGTVSVPAAFAYAIGVARERREAAAVAPEDDFRPLPSVAEVLAHNARTGGGTTAAPWLCLAIPDDPLSDLSVAWLGVAETADGPRVERVERGWTEAASAVLGAAYRPITHRGGALPWPEVPR